MAAGMKAGNRKKHMVFGSRPAMERMEKYLAKKGCTVHCADWDGDWFLVYSEPEPDRA